MSLDLDLIYSQFNFKVDKSDKSKVYEFENFRLDAVHLMLYQKDEEIPLVPKAVETLLVLVEKRGEILSKDELMKAIWTDSIVEEGNLAQYLHLLRKILGETKDGKPFIETFRRRGYRFYGEVSIADF
ncbi:MAG: winged helix-turn-helix domain-containing protein [Acidobacteria bacterium]|nr:winged helix-turn-helix domain-containing protein [Acidobacteriota bacterium]